MNRHARFSIWPIIFVFAVGIAVSTCSPSSPQSSPPCEVPVPVPPVPATPGEIEYSKWYEEIIKKIYAAQDRFDKALQKLKEKSTDTFQLVIIARELVNFGSYYDEASKKKVPSSFDCVHQSLMRALQEYKAALDAVNSGNTGELFDHIDKGKKLVFDAGKLYEQWNKGHK